MINLKKGKTETMIFGTSERLKEISLNVEEINGTSNCTCLGIYLDQTLNF